MRILIFGALAATVLLASNAVGQSTVDLPMICKAAIAKIMGRDPSIIRIDRRSSDVVFLSYTRADDRTRWAYRCRIDGNRVIWASDTGRWRDDPRDEKAYFERLTNPPRIRIVERFSDGSEADAVFPISKLR